MRLINPHITLIAHRSALDADSLADVPGRHEPGTGEINFPFLFRHLDAIGYDGWVGCEYTPMSGTVDSLAWRP